MTREEFERRVQRIADSHIKADHWISANPSAQESRKRTEHLAHARALTLELADALGVERAQ